MATITKEKIIKMNNQLHNGFKMDLMQLAMGEKVPTKKVDIDETKYLKASLHFSETYKEFKKTIAIQLNISLWHRGETSDVSHGLGTWQILENGLARKVFKELAKHTENITEKEILSIYEESKNKLNNGRIL